MKKIVGISEMIVSKDINDVLVTYSLGSCVGMSIYDPKLNIGGMIHCMLPLSKIDTEKARKIPAMFTDTGIPELLQCLFDMGSERKNLIAKIAGCSKLLDEKGMFKIGERNYIVTRKILWKNNILIAAEDTGGSIARTLSLYMDTGVTTVKSKGREVEL